MLAAFTATFAFAYGLLRRIQPDSVPSLGVTVAGVAIGGSVLLLVCLEHFAHGLRPVAVAAKVAAAGREVVMEISEHQATETAPAGEPALCPEKPLRTVRAVRSGAIQAVHHRGLVAAAVRDDCLLVLTRSVGDFIPAGAVVIEVYGSRRAPGSRGLAASLALGRERTIDQDPAFALRILVDIAIRALSPAVNDPTTATQVLDYIEGLLQMLGQADVQSPWRLVDRDGHIRVVLPARTWEDYLAVYRQTPTGLRQSIVGRPQVLQPDQA